MAILKNRAGVITATVGTGTVALGPAIVAGISPFSVGWQTFAASGVANGDSVRYLILDANGAWEYGPGTYTTVGLTLSRPATAMDGSVAGQKSSTGTLLALSGNAQVFVTAVAEDIPSIAGLASLAGPTFTGDPQAPTPTLTDNDTSIATTAFVKAAVLGSPQGRLTLVSGTPVMTTSQLTKPTIFYTPYVGQFAPIYDGTKFVMTDLGGELSQATNDATKSPAATVASKNYDMFVWDDAGTKRCTRGPIWSTDSVRGVGAGTTELEAVNGIWVNKNAITNGPAARRGTYVGTIRSDTAATCAFIFGSLGGTANLGVWNCYNRVPIRTFTADTTSTWTYSTAAYRACNANTNFVILIICGLVEDMIRVEHMGQMNNSATGYGYNGIGIDSTSSNSNNLQVISGNVSSTAISQSVIVAPPLLGYHLYQALEYVSAGTVTFNGSFNNVLTLDWRM